jgi:hypothetical protein
MEKEKPKPGSIESRWRADADEDLFEVLTESGTTEEEEEDEKLPE